MDLMTNLPRLAIFAMVAKTGSFTKAGQRLGIGKASVSKQVRALEEELGVRLLNRTTRSLGLTETGARVHAHCERILEEVKGVEGAVEAQAEEPRGTLRVACPLDFGRKVLAPTVSLLLEEYPKLDVKMMVNDQIIDLVDEGVDVAIRIGYLRDSSLIIKKLWLARYHLYASPEYLAKHGAPKTPQETLKHNWVLLNMTSTPADWVFRKGPKRQEVIAPSRLGMDSSIGVADAVCRGLGIAPFLDFLASEDLAAGRLVRLMPEYWLEPEVNVFAAYAHRGYQPAKVRLLLERIRGRILELTSE